MQNNKILLLFPDGIGIRNYLYSDVFIDDEAELVLFHNFDAETISALNECTRLSQAITIPEYRESLKEKFLRELICLARLNYNKRKVNNPSLLANWNWTQKTLFKKIFYKIIEIIAPFIKEYTMILKLEKSYQKAIRENSFYNEVRVILKQVQPTTVFCSHQRALKAATIFAVAKDLSIPTTTVIFSWDNLPKARMALRADRYLVWSDFMKKEMEMFYPEIPSKSIYVTGTPQFEFYNDERNIIDKELFFKKYNLDPAKKIICFSGDDEHTSPDDPSYLKDISQEFINANLQQHYQILLRRCPVDCSGRFDAIVKEYKELIKEAPPLWVSNSSKDWSVVCPSVDDVKLLVSTAFYADVVINVGSTMAFDFAMFNKPCIFINYDQENKTVKDWSVKTIYQFQHFKSMPNKEAVIWLNNKAEIVEKLTKQNDQITSMQLWKKIVIGDYNEASKRIRRTLQLE
ncbi:hypothetical protein [Flavobacterium sp.]|jgi:hypothetical protein|uniref:hypothetical protein n=1 Tax=Flavobacterium sp. TaxID=239 RepID=UPI0037C0D6A3